MLLGIYTNSFHYKYYQNLRKIWAFEDDGWQRNRTSLCLYTQFLFWFSLITLIVSPLMLGGWLLLKTGRFYYKVCSWTRWGRVMIDFMDEIGLGKAIDTRSKEMVISPAITLIMTFLGFLMFLFVVAFVLGLLIGGIVFFKAIILQIAVVLMTVCVGVFYVCFGIGWVLIHLWWVVIVVVKVICWFFVFYAAGIGMAIGSVLAAFLISFLTIKIVTSSTRLTNFLGFKLNGYQKARRDNSKRREELKRKQEEELLATKRAKETLKQKKKDGLIPYTFPEKIRNVVIRGLTVTGKALGTLLLAKTKKVGKGTFKVVTGLGVVWETLKAIKQGVCPLVEFIDDEDNAKEVSE